MLNYRKIIDVLEKIMQIKSEETQSEEDKKELKKQISLLEDMNQFHKEGSSALNNMDKEYFENMKSRLKEKNFSVEILQEEIHTNKNMNEYFEETSKEEKIEYIKEPVNMFKVEQQSKNEEIEEVQEDLEELENNDPSEEEIKNQFLGERMTSFFKNIKEKIFHKKIEENSEIIENDNALEDETTKEQSEYEEGKEDVKELENNDQSEEVLTSVSIFQKIKDKFTKKKENIIKSNEYADYYTYKHYKLCNQFVKKDELTVKDLQKYTKKVNQIVDEYDKLVDGSSIIEILDPLNNASYQIAQKNKSLMNQGVIYDEHGNIDIQSYVNYLNKDHNNHTYLEEVQKNSLTFTEVVEHQEEERQQELKKNACKVSLFKNLKTKLAILGLSIALIASSFQLKSCSKGVEREETIATTMDESQDLETILNDDQLKTSDQKKENIQEQENVVIEEETAAIAMNESETETLETTKEEVQEQDNAAIEKEAESLQTQRAYLESLRTRLAVSDEETEKYQEQLSIGDIVKVKSDAHIAESMDDLAKNDVKTSYYKDSIYRVVQSIGMKNEDGDIVNVKDMETYEKLKEEGYEVFGVSVLNQYSQTEKDIEGRFATGDISLVKSLK